jgi:hypothetical protein
MDGVIWQRESWHGDRSLFEGDGSRGLPGARWSQHANSSPNARPRVGKSAARRGEGSRYCETKLVFAAARKVPQGIRSQAHRYRCASARAADGS